MSALIRRHMLILGPNIARDMAFSVPGLTIDASGAAVDLKGSGLLIIRDLAEAYGNLSLPITQIILHSLLEDYPEIKREYNQPVPKIELACNLNGQAGLPEGAGKAGA